MKATHVLALMVALLSGIAALVILQDTPDSLVDLTLLERRRARQSLAIAALLLGDGLVIASLT